MTHTLLLRLGHSPTEAVEWIYCAGATPTSWLRGQLDNMDALTSLTEYARQSSVTVLIPGDSVLFRTVELTGAITAQTVKALPYLIEESVISDIEQLHLVTLAREGTTFHLMGIAIDQLTAWLEALQQAGIVPHQLVPDLLAVPFNEVGWNACKVADQWIIRTAAWSGVVIKAEWVEALLAEWNDLPPVTAYSEDPTLPHQWQRGELAGLAYLAQQPLAELPTLLTGKFRPKFAHTALPRWCRAAGLAATCLLLGLLTIGLDGYQLQQQTGDLKQQQSMLYHQLMPNDHGEIHDPRGKLQSHMKQLQLSALQPGFLWLLKEAAPLLAQLPKTALHAIRYDAAETGLQLFFKKEEEPKLRELIAGHSTELQLNIDKTKSNVGNEMIALILKDKHD